MKMINWFRKSMGNGYRLATCLALLAMVFGLGLVPMAFGDDKKDCPFVSGGTLSKTTPTISIKLKYNDPPAVVEINCLTGGIILGAFDASMVGASGATAKEAIEKAKKYDCGFGFGGIGAIVDAPPGGTRVYKFICK